MIDPAGAPVTMISVGSGDSCLLDPNQLQADIHANVMSTKIFNRYPHVTTKAPAYHGAPMSTIQHRRGAKAGQAQGDGSWVSISVPGSIPLSLCAAFDGID